MHMIYCLFSTLFFSLLCRDAHVELTTNLAQPSSFSWFVLQVAKCPCCRRFPARFRDSIPSSPALRGHDSQHQFLVPLLQQHLHLDRRVMRFTAWSNACSLNGAVLSVRYSVGRLWSPFPIDLDLTLNLLASSCTILRQCLSIGGSDKL